MSGIIWIDVTDFLKWQGNFTAFQHIQYHMAQLYMASDHDAAFFVYDEPSHSFSKVDFDPDKLSHSGMRIETMAVPPVGRRFLQKAKQATPAPAKRALKKLMKARPLAQSDAAHVNGHAPFAQGDTVVVLGGIWHGSFATDMAIQKQQKGFRFVHVVHDMVPVVCPQCVVEDLPEVFAAYKEKIFSIADGLLINSESSKKDAIAFMKQRKIAIPKHTVFRLADEVATGKTPRAVHGLRPQEFILSLGTIEGRKNHMLLYYVYKQAARQGITLPKMVIAGRHGWLVEDFFYLVSRDPEIKDKIIVLEGVDNEERAWLYKHCLLTVWPSFYEGWGMPVAEGLTYGKVSLSTDTSSMPEIGGKLVDYFSPFDPQSCLQLIVKYLDTSTRQRREQEIKRNYRVTTWEDMFQVVSQFIDSV